MKTTRILKKEERRSIEFFILQLDRCWEKSEFTKQLSSFFCGSVSYFNTFYNDKLKTRYQTSQNNAFSCEHRLY